MEVIHTDDGGPGVPVHAVTQGSWAAAVETYDPATRAAATAAGFTGEGGQLVCVPDAGGGIHAALFGIGDGSGGAMAFRALSGKLPAGDYVIASCAADLDPGRIAVAWALGAYRFDRYKSGRTAAKPRLILPAQTDVARPRLIAHACALARDMVNTPANDMGPLQVETIARQIAHAHGARITVEVGEALIAAGYPVVHAVGRAAVAARAPRMIEITWGEADRPLVAVIGKGVVFDSGGLDIKPAAGMRWMKKDRGGAAHALALARMIMASGLPVRLAVLLPVVENAIAGDAMRPGDVLASRKGLTIEVGNTDAEGRLILADALARAGELVPALTIDLATLTGAARVALGPDVVPFYATSDSLADEIAAASRNEQDPLWRMPLWDGYAASLDSDIADIRNDADAWAQAGSVTAALFLKAFAPDGDWIHCDIFAWNPRPRPGWPQGGEAQAIRALFTMIEAKFPA